MKAIIDIMTNRIGYTCEVSEIGSTITVNDYKYKVIGYDDDSIYVLLCGGLVRKRKRTEAKKATSNVKYFKGSTIQESGI